MTKTKNMFFENYYCFPSKLKKNPKIKMIPNFFLQIAFFTVLLSAQDDHTYEEHATVNQIMSYLSNFKATKDVDILYIPLHNQSFYPQDFIKTKEDVFFNIYNHNKSQSILLRDLTQNYTNPSSDPLRLSVPFTTTVNSFNSMTLKTFNDSSYLQEISIFGDLSIKETTAFRSSEELSLFQIEVLIKKDFLLKK